MGHLQDVLIIGGGPAGLSAALSLARLLHTVVVFDSGLYRNRFADRMHTLPTWDHQRPADYRAAARKELGGRYKEQVEVVDVGVERVERLGDGTFKAVDARGGEWFGKKVLLAVGSKDVHPDIKGYEENWGTGIYHCLFCHGFEETGASTAGVLAVGDVANLFFATHLAKQASQFAKQTTIYTHGNEKLTLELAPAIASLPHLRVEPRAIAAIEKTGGAGGRLCLTFADGAQETVGFVIHKPKTVANGPFAEQLGLEMTPAGDVKVGQPFPETNVKGVFALGDCATGMKSVPMAVSAGMVAAAGASMQLLQ